MGFRQNLAQNGRCKTGYRSLTSQGKNQTVVEYASRDTTKPIGVSEYHITRQLPELIKEKVPSIEDLEEVVSKLLGELDENKA